MPRKKKKLVEVAPSTSMERPEENGNVNVSSDDNYTTDARKNQGILNSANSRTRVWATIVYPDSAPADWRDQLIEAHVQAFVSPLHDKDVNPDGSAKKAHWHVLIMYDSVKSQAQAQVLRDAIGGVGWEQVASTRGYARYLCHLDNPEKAQYSPEDVVEYGGADYRAAIVRSTDSVVLFRQMREFIYEHNILYYSDFVDVCAAERPEWLEAIVNGQTYAVSTYIRERMRKNMDERGIVL